MKLEMAESLFYSWLKHEKQCPIVQTNWKPSQTWKRENENKLKQIKMATDKYFQKYHNYNISKKDTSTTKISQMLKQAEIDALGISFHNAAIKDIYAVDVAFHEAGLNYGKDTIPRIIKKCVRSAMCLYGYFNINKGTVIFASPKINPTLVESLNKCIEELQQTLTHIGFNFEFRIIANDEFKTQILDPVINMDIEDTNELFVRSMQLFKMFKKQPM